MEKLCNRRRRDASHMMCLCKNSLMEIIGIFSFAQSGKTTVEEIEVMQVALETEMSFSTMEGSTIDD